MFLKSLMIIFDTLKMENRVNLTFISPVIILNNIEVILTFFFINLISLDFTAKRHMNHEWTFVHL